VAGSDPFRLEQFHDYLTYERGLSARTVAAYGRDLEKWHELVTANGARGPSDVTPRLLREWVFALKDAGLAPTSIRRAQSAVRTYYAFLTADGAVTADPTDRLESPKIARKLPEFLSIDEVERLLEASDETKALYWRDRAILELLYASGMRVSELVDIPIAALDLEEGIATVVGKGAKERIVPIGAPAGRALERYLRDVRPALDRGKGAGRVFLNARGRPLRREAVWTLVASAAKRAGITRHVSPHTLRHTFATHLVEGGADLTHLDRDYLRQVHRRFHPRG
jgi:integrase/recombinase XerD